MQDWAEVHRLFHREGWSKTAIAEKFQMSRNTVSRLLSYPQPPRYVRQPAGSSLDPFVADIVSMLEDHPKVPATVILERLAPLGYRGGITALKERVARLRPGLHAAKSYQRTSYLPGELAQLDWWGTGVQIPSARVRRRRPSGSWASLPHSAAHATVFTFGRTTAEFCAAVVGCFTRLGGVPEKAPRRRG